MTLRSTPPYRIRQQGMSLVIVLVFLATTMILGVGAVQLSMMSERSARNDRDYQVAWQASEAALRDAELDIDVTNAGTSTRAALFTTDNAMSFATGCSSSGTTKGLCLPSLSGKPVWLEVDFSADNTPSVGFGSFTNQTFATGDSGLRPRKAPRYIIEQIEDTASRGDASIGREQKYVYRITAMGFGPRDDIQAVTQSIYRK